MRYRQVIDELIKKRRFPRRRFRRPVGLLISGNYMMASAEEIGEGGISLNSPMDVTEGQQILVTFIIPGGEPAVVRGEVRFHALRAGQNSFRIGIQFMTIGFKQKKKLRDYIAAKTEDEAYAERQQSENRTANAKANKKIV